MSRRQVFCLGEFHSFVKSNAIAQFFVAVVVAAVIVAVVGAVLQVACGGGSGGAVVLLARPEPAVEFQLPAAWTWTCCLLFVFEHLQPAPDLV